MELNEAARRIVGQHWALILLLVALGVGLAVTLHRSDVDTYTASARLVLDTKDPESRAESAAIADTAKAIATSPSQVRDALKDANLARRDAAHIAKNRVSVRALGSSGVVQLTVTDANPRVAAALANALADRVIRTRRDVTQGEVEQARAELDRKIEAMNRRISRADAEVDALAAQVGTASSGEAARSLRAQRDAVERLRGLRNFLESERASLLSSAALRPKALVISRADTPTRADASRRLADLVLGGLLGLVLGVALAGLIETFRPTLAGADVLAREFDTPLLGNLPAEPDDETALEDAVLIAQRLRLTADGARVRSVNLLAAGPPVELARFADRLQAALDGAVLDDSRVEHELPWAVESAAGTRTWPVAVPETKAETAGDPHRGVRVQPFNPAQANGAPVGLVLVSPTSLKKSDVDDLSRTLRLASWPLLGLVTYRRRGATAEARPRKRR